MRAVNIDGIAHAHSTQKTRASRQEKKRHQARKRHICTLNRMLKKAKSHIIAKENHHKQRAALFLPYQRNELAIKIARRKHQWRRRKKWARRKQWQNKPYQA